MKNDTIQTTGRVFFTRYDVVQISYSFNLKISNTGRQTTTQLQIEICITNKQKKENIVSKQDKGVKMFTQ